MRLDAAAALAGFGASAGSAAIRARRTRSAQQAASLHTQHPQQRGFQAKGSVGHRTGAQHEIIAEIPCMSLCAYRCEILGIRKRIEIENCKLKEWFGKSTSRSGTREFVSFTFCRQPAPTVRPDSKTTYFPPLMCTLAGGQGLLKKRHCQLSTTPYTLQDLYLSIDKSNAPKGRQGMDSGGGQGLREPTATEARLQLVGSDTSQTGPGTDMLSMEESKNYCAREKNVSLG